MKMGGFVLFEYMIAFSCSVLLLAIITSIFGELYIRSSRYSEQCIATIEMSRAWFLLERDLAYAPSDILLWKKRAPTEFAYSTSSGDCGWLMKRDRLLRIRGFYDAGRGSWHQAHETVALIGIQNFMVHWIMPQGSVLGCEVTYGARGSVMKYVVACCHNRQLSINRLRVKP